jgi:Bax protein
MQEWLNMPRGALIARATVLVVLTITAAALIAIFRQSGQQLPAEVLAVTRDAQITTSLPDFEAIENVDEKKEAFFSFLIDYVEAENARILDDRLEVLELWEIARADNELSDIEVEILSEIATHYRMDPALPHYEQLRELVLRVDTIPPSLVLAQAANESAWGTSRFAKEGNNIFGQWCFDECCGLIPERRSSEAAHEVRAFLSVEDAVRSYFRNINTHAAYAELREMRSDMRESGRPLDALVLAHGLRSYSERGQIYVNELHALIRQNRLQRLDNNS